MKTRVTGKWFRKYIHFSKPTVNARLVFRGRNDLPPSISYFSLENWQTLPQGGQRSPFCGSEPAQPLTKLARVTATRPLVLPGHHRHCHHRCRLGLPATSHHDRFPPSHRRLQAIIQFDRMSSKYTLTPLTLLATQDIQQNIHYISVIAAIFEIVGISFSYRAFIRVIIMMRGTYSKQNIVMFQ